MKLKSVPFRPFYCGGVWERTFLLPLAEFQVWMYHYSLEGEGKRSSWPSIETICKKCDLDRKTVFKARKWLIENKWLIKVGKKAVKGKYAVPIFRVERGLIPKNGTGANMGKYRKTVLVPEPEKP